MAKDDTNGKRVRLRRREVEREERESGGKTANIDKEIGAALVKIADLIGIDEASKRAASDAKIEASELAAFCVSRREAFYRDVGSAIQNLCNGFGSGRNMPSEGHTTGKLDEYEAAIAKVRELIEFDSFSGFDAPAKPLEGAAMHARGLVQGALLPEVLLGAPDVLDALTEAIGKAKTNVESNAVYRRRGRNPGAGGGIANEWFLSELISNIRKFGGEVRHSQTKPTHPSKASPYLGKIVECLRPFLPAKFPRELAHAYEAAGRRLSAPVVNSIKKRP